MFIVWARCVTNNKQRHEIEVSRKARRNISAFSSRLRKRRTQDLVKKISQNSHNMANELSQRVGLFNCDGTYKLDAVERFLMGVGEKHGFEFSTHKHYFGVNEMTKFCETTVPQLRMDFAFFVVHAEESRLSINEDNAGIGYTKIYRALLQATGEWSGSI